MIRLLAWLDRLATRHLDRHLIAAGVLPERRPAKVDALDEWRRTRAVNPRPIPCQRCKCMTWDGLHRNGSRDCDAWEAS